MKNSMSLLLLFSIFFAARADFPSNTATGESPTEIIDRKAREREEKILKTGTDQQRWRQFVLFSESVKPQDLEVLLIKSDNFKMQLQPQTGRLVFVQGSKIDAFNAGVPHGAKNNVCPAYQFNVLHAETGMALVRKICPGFEYDQKPGKDAKYHREVNYLLYDAKTASLLVLWRNVQSTKGGPKPTPDELPVIKRINNGYELDWRATDLVEKRKFHIHTRYTAEKVDGKLELVCRDLTAPKGEEFGVNCEYGQLSRLN
ncbi:hypothetical protein V8J88_18735 [Massilia sp. W12]|uniref:hypothetical protein n=1 Tax=Massilia sp. W12 TaxID=3126507 RepID=UPI0030CD7ACE